MSGTGLEAVTDDADRFAVLAIDHRDSLRRYLAPDDPESLTAEDITALKIELAAGVGDLASGVMLEPEYSIPQVPDAGVLPVGVGFFAALESQGYLGDPGAAPTTVLEGWSVALAKSSGAAAVKLLLPYHPDRPLASAQENVAAVIVEECRREGLPLALEPLFYDLDAPMDRPRVVVETARRFATMRPALLKLPYPGSVEACETVTVITDGSWAMLSGGGSFSDFVEDFTIAVSAGCSGFMIGRALWGEAARSAGAERAAVIRDVVRPRFEELVAINARV